MRNAGLVLDRANDISIQLDRSCFGNRSSLVEYCHGPTVPPVRPHIPRQICQPHGLSATETARRSIRIDRHRRSVHPTNIKNLRKVANG